MTSQRPITPPAELVREWYNASPHTNEKALQDVANAAAQWGADTELEACIGWLDDNLLDVESIQSFRAVRRPEPPSLKEQALKALKKGCFPSDDEISTIRRALDQLND
jgi:hypothetical protein